MRRGGGREGGQLTLIYPPSFQGSCTHDSSFRVIHNIRRKDLAGCARHRISHGASAEGDADREIIFSIRLDARTLLSRQSLFIFHLIAREGESPVSGVGKSHDAIKR